MFVQCAFRRELRVSEREEVTAAVAQRRISTARGRARSHAFLLPMPDLSTHP